jgi:hypothetical protein
MAEYIQLDPDVKEWNRNTVADGNWMNTNTIIPLKQNIKKLIDAGTDISQTVSQLSQAIAAMHADYSDDGEPDQYIAGIVQTDGVVSANVGQIKSVTQSEIAQIFNEN